MDKIRQICVGKHMTGIIGLKSALAEVAEIGRYGELSYPALVIQWGY